MKAFRRVLCLCLIALTLVTMFPVHSHAASVSFYQTSKADVPIWSAASSSSTKLKTIGTQGTVLRVIGSTRNAAGNLWYQLQDYSWVFSGNVIPHYHTYHGGYCTGIGCGYEWPYAVSNYYGTFVVTNVSGAKIWSRPYSNNSTHIRTAGYWEVLSVIAQTTNADGNKWYKLSDGRWVFSGNVLQRYTVSYNANGGSGAPGAQYAYAGQSLTVPSTKPTRAGYVFQGWATSAGSSNVVCKPGNAYKFGSDVTLYAVWKACSHSFSNGICDNCGYEYPISVKNHSGTYVVTNADGAKVWSRPYSGKSTHIRTEKLNAVLTVTGKTTNAADNLWYRLSDGYWVFSGNVAQRFTVSFNANGGSGAPSAQYAVDGQYMKVSSQVPTRRGYAFQGWSNAAGSSKVVCRPGKSYIFTGDMTLYAVWSACSHKNYTGGYCDTCGYEYPLSVKSYKATYVVTNKDGATIRNRPYSKNSTKIRVDQKNTVLSVIAKVTNQEGNLWYQLSDGNWVFSDNVKIRYTITYNANGGSGAPGNQYAISGSFLTISTKKPTRSGYIFRGWCASSEANSVDYEPGGMYRILNNRNLYAVWKKCPHTKSTGGYCDVCGLEIKLTVVDCNATFVVTNKDGTKVWSRPYSKNSTHVRTEKYNAVLNIVGKAENAEGNIWYKLADGNWIFSGNVTQRYTITYNANGGKNAPNSQTFLKGQGLKISTKKPTRVGYTFQGWGTSANADKVTYKAGSTYKITGNKTLYAVWKKCSHKNYAGGYCDDCGYEYKLTITDFNATFVVNNKDGAKIWSRPYSKNSIHVRTEKYNLVMKVIAKTVNEEGNVWYQLADGRWVFSGNLARRYTIQYHANGGKNAPASHYAVEGRDTKLSTKKPTRVGYVFQGWGTAANATKVTYKAGSTYKFTGNKTLYAIWKKCAHSSYTGGYCDACGLEFKLKVTDYNATFVVNNKSGAKIWSRPYSKNSTHVRTEKYDKILTVVAKTVNEEGNTWYKLNDGRWVFSGNVAARYTIKYNANGGTGAPTNQYAVKGRNAALSTQIPHRLGYVFQGWGNSASTKTVSYAPGGKYKFTAHKTLYAVWSTCTSHSYDKAGICTKCGLERPFTVKELATGIYEVTSDSATFSYAYQRPFTGSPDAMKIQKGDLVKVTAQTNIDSVKWYRLADGNWIQAGKLTKRGTMDGSKAVISNETLAAKVTTVKTISQSRTSAMNYLKKHVGKVDISKTIPGLLKSVTRTKAGTSVTTCNAMVPQGFTYTDEFTLISAYCKCGKDHRSVVYVIDSDTQKYLTTVILDDICHVGGLAVLGDYLWVCDSGHGDTKEKLLRPYSMEDIRRSVSLGVNYWTVKIAGDAQKVDVTPSYMCSANGYLYVGKFYEKTEKAKIYYYKAVGTNLEDVGSFTISGVKQIQGISIRDDYMVVTASYGRFNASKVYVYKDTKGFAADGKTYSKPKKTFQFANMVEGCYLGEDYTYFLFESGAKEYRGTIGTRPLDKYVAFRNETLGIG